MTRLAATVMTLGLTAAGSAAGVFPPIPRPPESALKGLDPKADEPMAESPEKIAERIAQNAKAATDRLAGQDTGSDTRKTQDQILRDIDALLKQAENPPPSGGQSNNSSDMNQSGNQGNQSQNQGGGQSSPSGRKPPMGGQQPKGGQQPGGGSRRDRRNQEKGGDPQPGGLEKQPTGKGEQPGGQQPMGKGEQGPMQPGGQPGGANPQGGMGGRATPDLPLDEAITKQVWGHLPERLRQQMNQYYREQFMPRYGELLKQYYSALAEREKAAKK